MADTSKLIRGEPPPPYGATPTQPRPAPAYISQYPEQTATAIVHTQVQIVPRPVDYTVLAIVAIFFFFPLGILSLVQAKKSVEYVRSGMMAEAYRASVLARLFARLAITFGIVHITIVVCCAVVVAVTSI